MTTPYLSICARYGPAPLLLAVFLLSFLSALAGFYALIISCFSGIIGASLSEGPAMLYLRQRGYGLARGSTILCWLQVACVIAGLGIGAAAEYKFNPEMLHAAAKPSINSIF